MRSKHSVFAVYSACCLKLLNKHTNETIFSITWDNDEERLKRKEVKERFIYYFLKTQLEI